MIMTVLGAPTCGPTGGAADHALSNMLRRVKGHRIRPNQSGAIFDCSLRLAGLRGNVVLIGDAERISRIFDHWPQELAMKNSGIALFRGIPLRPAEKTRARHLDISKHSDARRSKTYWLTSPRLVGSAVVDDWPLRLRADDALQGHCLNNFFFFFFFFFLKFFEKK